MPHSKNVRMGVVNPRGNTYAKARTKCRRSGATVMPPKNKLCAQDAPAKGPLQVAVKNRILPRPEAKTEPKQKGNAKQNNKTEKTTQKKTTEKNGNLNHQRKQKNKNKTKWRSEASASFNPSTNGQRARFRVTAVSLLAHLTRASFSSTVASSPDTCVRKKRST
jgi:hypothetical protein